MGQEVSSPIDESLPPHTLEARSVEAIAKYINDGRVSKIVVMTGAGISTSAGIPDFRSPDTGLYANLARLDLPYPEAVFDISFFRDNPLPFYTLARELYPGKYQPTVSHAFIRLLLDKGLLLKLFTQNIDCLERKVGITEENIVEAHGSFASQRCIECKTLYPDDLMKNNITSQEIPRCLALQCNGLVKPDIIFFGERLPEAFHQNRGVPQYADLCIVMGTSLTVQPFASLPSSCSENVPRLLINSERVGDLGCRADDVLLLGDCDDGVRKLTSALGWEKDLDAICNIRAPNLDCTRNPLEREKRKGDALEDQIALLTEEIDKSLKLASEHTSGVQGHLIKQKAGLSHCTTDANGAEPDPGPATREQNRMHSTGQGTPDVWKVKLFPMEKANEIQTHSSSKVLQ